MARVSLSICAYLVSVFDNALLAYAMGVQSRTLLFCNSIAPSPTGMPSIISSVFCLGSKYDMVASASSLSFICLKVFSVRSGQDRVVLYLVTQSASDMVAKF